MPKDCISRSSTAMFGCLISWILTDMRVQLAAQIITIRQREATLQRPEYHQNLHLVCRMYLSEFRGNGYTEVHFCLTLLVIVAYSWHHELNSDATSYRVVRISTKNCPPVMPRRERIRCIVMFTITAKLLCSSGER